MSWVDEALATLDDDGEMRERLDAFRAAPPTVTLVGAFNTGKSSLLKRLCADRDAPLPDELVIDAAPATATTYEVELDGIRWRDTPGLDSGTVEHGRLTDSVALLTDALLLGVTHELFSVDSDVGQFLTALRAAGPLPPHALRCAILRADDAAGTDGGPRLADWSATKRDEAAALLARLGLDDVAVDVVIADARGRNAKRDAGYDRSREWDGVAAFYEAITNTTGTATQREAAITRYVNTALDQACAVLEARLEAIEADATQRETTERLNLILDRLDTFTVRAREALREALIGAAGGPTQTIQQRFGSAYERWTAVHARELQQLAREVDVVVDPWRMDESLPDIELEFDNDETPEDEVTEGLHAWVRDKAFGRLEDDPTQVKQLEDDLRAWEAAKRKHKTREFYADGDSAFSGVGEVREAKEQMKRLRRRQALLSVATTGYELHREERSERNRRRAERERTQVLRDMAESHAAIVARTLFDGAEVPGWRRHVDAVAEEARARREELARDEAAVPLRAAIKNLRAVRASSPA